MLNYSIVTIHSPAIAAERISTTDNLTDLHIQSLFSVHTPGATSVSLVNLFLTHHICAPRNRHNSDSLKVWDNKDQNNI